MPVPLQIRTLRAIKARLEQIQIASGYLTDAGDSIYAGPRQLEKADCPAICVIDGGDSATANTGSNASMTLAQTVYLDCFVRAYADEDDSGEAITELAADAKQAVLDIQSLRLQDDDGYIGSVLAYVGRTPIDGQDGIEGQRIELNLTLKEGYGNPYESR